MWYLIVSIPELAFFITLIEKLEFKVRHTETGRFCMSLEIEKNKSLHKSLIIITYANSVVYDESA